MEREELPWPGPLRVPGQRAVCGFCLRGVSRDTASVPPPSVPKSLLEPDAAALVCPACSQLFHRVYESKSREVAYEATGTRSEREIQRRYPSVPFTNHSIDYTKRLHLLLVAKTLSCHTGGFTSVASFSLENIPYTSPSAFAFAAELLHFGVNTPTDGGNRRPSISRPSASSMQGISIVHPGAAFTEAYHTSESGEEAEEQEASNLDGEPWPTAYYLREPKYIMIDSDPQARKRSRLSWCDFKDPCLYCRDHIEAMLSGRTRGSRRKSCSEAPESWKTMDEKSRWEIREMALARAHGIQPFTRFPQTPQSRVPPTYSLSQPFHHTTFPQNYSNSQPLTHANCTAEVTGIAPDVRASVVDTHSTSTMDELSLERELTNGDAPPTKRRRLRRMDDNIVAEEPASASISIDENTEVQQSATNSANQEVSGKMEEKGEGEMVEREEDETQTVRESSDAEKTRKPRKRLRGLSKELRSLQLWSHWTEEGDEDEATDEGKKATAKIEEESETSILKEKVTTSRRNREAKKSNKSDGEESSEVRRSRRSRKAKSFDDEQEMHTDKKDQGKHRTKGEGKTSTEVKKKKPIATVSAGEEETRAQDRRNKSTGKAKDDQHRSAERKRKSQKDSSSENGAQPNEADKPEHRKRWQDNNSPKSAPPSVNPPREVDKAAEALMSLIVDTNGEDSKKGSASDSEKRQEPQRSQSSSESEDGGHNRENPHTDRGEAKSPAFGDANGKHTLGAAASPIHLPSFAAFVLGSAKEPVGPTAQHKITPPAQPSSAPQPSAATPTLSSSPYASYPANGGYPYSLVGRSIGMTPEAYSALASSIAHLSPLYTQILQQSLLYPNAAAAIGGPAAASHATQTLLYTPLLNLPQFVPVAAQNGSAAPSSTTASNRTAQASARSFSHYTPPPSRPPQRK